MAASITNAAYPARADHTCIESAAAAPPPEPAALQSVREIEAEHGTQGGNAIAPCSVAGFGRTARMMSVRTCCVPAGGRVTERSTRLLPESVRCPSIGELCTRAVGGELSTTLRERASTALPAGSRRRMMDLIIVPLGLRPERPLFRKGATKLIQLHISKLELAGC